MAIILKDLFLFLIMYLHACLCVCAAGCYAHSVQKGAPIPLEKELQVIMSGLIDIGADIETLASARTASSVPAEPSPYLRNGYF